MDMDTRMTAPAGAGAGSRRGALTKVSCGVWRHESGRLLLRMTMQGPRGGRRVVWESAYEDADGLYLEDPVSHPTRSACQLALEERLKGGFA